MYCTSSGVKPPWTKAATGRRTPKFIACWPDEDARQRKKRESDTSHDGAGSRTGADVCIRNGQDQLDRSEAQHADLVVRWFCDLVHPFPVDAADDHATAFR